MRWYEVRLGEEGGYVENVELGAPYQYQTPLGGRVGGGYKAKGHLTG